MTIPVKVPACGSVIQIDTGDGDGFIVQGQTDSITPPPREKAVNESPDLTCTVDANVGQEQVSQSSFTQFYDLQDTDQEKIDTNFEDSKADLSKREVTVQQVTPTYISGNIGDVAATVTREYTAQIVGISEEALTPTGYYKRTVTLLRTGPITKTVA